MDYLKNIVILITLCAAFIAAADQNFKFSGYEESGPNNPYETFLFKEHDGQDQPLVHVQPEWVDPSYTQIQFTEENQEFERRRPLFLPIGPFHPFYPHPHHAHPSQNEEEFQTIEALRAINLNNPNSINSEDYMAMPIRYFQFGSHNFGNKDDVPNSDPITQGSYNPYFSFKAPYAVHQGLHVPHVPINNYQNHLSNGPTYHGPYGHMPIFPFHEQNFHKEMFHGPYSYGPSKSFIPSMKGSFYDRFHKPSYYHVSNNLHLPYNTQSFKEIPYTPFYNGQYGAHIPLNSEHIYKLKPKGLLYNRPRKPHIPSNFDDSQEVRPNKPALPHYSILHHSHKVSDKFHHKPKPIHPVPRSPQVTASNRNKLDKNHEFLFNKPLYPEGNEFKPCDILGILGHGGHHHLPHPEKPHYEVPHIGDEVFPDIFEELGYEDEGSGEKIIPFINAAEIPLIKEDQDAYFGTDINNTS